jgi:predicted dehydrogenase/threonine dehydrogenase-like Zn-dependent dehydrogenase
MRQVLQWLRSGETEVADVPCPAPGPGHLLVRTEVTLISPGTERSLIEFGRGGLVSKARQQPERVRQVIDKVKSDGLLPTLDAVFHKLDQPLPLGYCNVGRVVEVGRNVTGFTIGDRVASNGRHAEFVAVPIRLCAKVPPSVTAEAAAFTVLASIALNGVRLAKPTLGETVVVMGLGPVGLLAVQLLRANGCRVIAIDFDEARLALAASFGAFVISLHDSADPVSGVVEVTAGKGVDAVLIAASTGSNAPVKQAAQMCRKRGRIVLVGVAGLQLDRADFYEKELTFQVSCSYGPGRYDDTYEQQGIDYPIGFVRWTEQRNFEAVLELLADGKLRAEEMVSARFTIDQAADAYEQVLGQSSALGVLLQYPPKTPAAATVAPVRTIALGRGGVIGSGIPQTVRVGFLGAGNYAQAVLIPAFKAAGAALRTVASAQGVSSIHAARKYGFANATTDVDQVLNDPEIEAVVIATRHDSHARLAVAALRAGKHVFVEKPLAIDPDQLKSVADAWQEAQVTGHRVLTVGFNRRFSTLTLRALELLRAVPEPRAIMITVNAGSIPRGHWTQDAAIGGGRIIGEACHFVDLAICLAGAGVSGHDVSFLDSHSADSAAITLRFDNGSIATINYLANGNRRVPKERVEVYAGGKVLCIDNFRTLTGYGWTRFSKLGLWRQDKGQRQCARVFLQAVRSATELPIPAADILQASAATLALAYAAERPAS